MTIALGGKGVDPRGKSVLGMSRESCASACSVLGRRFAACMRDPRYRAQHAAGCVALCAVSTDGCIGPSRRALTTLPQLEPYRVDQAGTAHRLVHGTSSCPTGRSDSSSFSATASLPRLTDITGCIYFVRTNSGAVLVRGMPEMKYTWPGDANLAMSVVVNVEEGSEGTIADGDRGPEPVDELGIVLKKPIRNYANESNYRYGIKAGAPRVLRLLEQYKISATFTVAALALERAPELARAIVKGGHEACSHGWRWVHQFHMEEAEERAFIRKAVELDPCFHGGASSWLAVPLPPHAQHTTALQRAFSITG